MTKKQESYFEMMSEVKLITDEYSAVWGGTPMFSTACTHFTNDVLAVMPAAFAERLRTSAGITIGKKELRTALEAAVDVMAGQIAVYAVTISDDVLRAAARVSPTDLRKSTDDGLVGKAARIMALANAHLSALAPFGITSAVVAALSARTAAFSATIGTPRAAIIAKKRAGDDIEQLRHQGMVDLELMDALMPLWRISEPRFYSRYFAARRIPNKGHLHRALTLRVHDAQGQPVAGAIFTIESAHIRRRTTVKGQVYVQHLKAGKYDAIISKDGYTDMLLTIYINSDKGTVLEVALASRD